VGKKLAKKSWIQVVNEWHLWPGLAVVVTAIIASAFFLLLGLLA
jgi:hypothetical protein